MNWWGKLIGTGVGMLGGPVGALAGSALGHLYDEDDPTPKNEQKARILYLAYFFSCAAKMAKADGGISAAEIETVESIMNRMGMDEKTREFAKNVFRKAKTSRRSIDEDGNEVELLTKGRHDPCVGIRGVPVAEAMMALTLADHLMRHHAQCEILPRV